MRRGSWSVVVLPTELQKGPEESFAGMTWWRPRGGEGRDGEISDIFHNARHVQAGLLLLLLLGGVFYAAPGAG